MTEVLVVVALLLMVSGLSYAIGVDHGERRERRTRSTANRFLDDRPFLDKAGTADKEESGIQRFNCGH